MNYLLNKHIVMGVTGGIAAYKSAELVRVLRQQGAQVRVIMTEHAKQFITDITLQALSGNPVHDNLFDPAQEAAMGHIALARWADLIVIAPASANFLANLCHGAANNLLTTVCLATSAPIFVAPAMNQQMWAQASTQANIALLQTRGIQIVGPDTGEQACGDVGLGRMEQPEQILVAIEQYFATGLLAGRHVLITAGPTQEAIDPVRYLSNYSTGKMGYALARAAQAAGASVTLISGPCHLPAPAGVAVIPVITALEMQQAVQTYVTKADIFIATAAVADYRCAEVQPRKIKKSSAGMTLTLVPNPDILAEVAAQSPRPWCVGFAAETHDEVAHARDKLTAKKLDMIIANRVGFGIGFGTDEHQVTLLTQQTSQPLGPASKILLAEQIITAIAEQFNKEIS